MQEMSETLDLPTQNSYNVSTIISKLGLLMIVLMSKQRSGLRISIQCMQVAKRIANTRLDLPKIAKRGNFMEEIKSFLRSRQPVNLIIAAANILVFLVLSFFGDTENAAFMAAHGASVTAYGEQGEYYRLFTCMFLHFGLEHLFYNMLVLIFLGDALEEAVGKVRYLVIYLGGGLIGNVVSVLIEIQKGESIVSAGASGAIFSVIGALVFIVLKNHGNLGIYSGKRLVLMAVLSILQSMTATGVDNSAHIGGFAAGFVLAFLLGAEKKAAAHTDFVDKERKNF